MGRSILFLAASISLAFVNPASARDVKISGTHSVSNIEIHCIDNGGTFFNGPKGGYGCAGSGGGTVTCTAKGKCTGTVSRVAGGGGKGKGITGVINSLNGTKTSNSTTLRRAQSQKTINTPSHMQTSNQLKAGGGRPETSGKSGGMNQGGGHHR
jgi:hypothetical protein